MKKILFILLFSFLFMSCKLIFWHETKPEIVGYKKVSLGIVNINSFPEFSKEYAKKIVTSLSADRRIYYRFLEEQKKMPESFELKKISDKYGARLVMVILPKYIGYKNYDRFYLFFRKCGLDFLFSAKIIVYDVELNKILFSKTYNLKKKIKREFNILDFEECLVQDVSVQERLFSQHRVIDDFARKIYHDLVDKVILIRQDDEKK